MEVLEDPIHHIMMGETAENLVKQYEITREEQDEVVSQSYIGTEGNRVWIL